MSVPSSYDGQVASEPASSLERGACRGARGSSLPRRIESRPSSTPRTVGLRPVGSPPTALADPHRLEHLQLPPAARAPGQVGADRLTPGPGQAVEEVAKGFVVHDGTGEAGPPVSPLACHRF